MSVQTYFAFISYKRGGKEQEIANWIHAKLEKYPYPQDMVAVENRPGNDMFIRPVFLDMKDLATSPHSFSDDIKNALSGAKYLIVICSQETALSKYVNMEVNYFLETHNHDCTNIIPVFIDKVDAKYLPQALVDSDILSRHCPIYNTFLSNNNEINQYCFYHIVSYLLNVDFKSIYSRYRTYAARKHKNRKNRLRAGICLLLLTAAMLVFALYRQTQANMYQKSLVHFENEIFPLSVVYGYTENFLFPVIEYIKKNESEARMYVLLPINKEHLSHYNRTVYIKEALDIDSLKHTRLNTRLKRGSLVMEIASHEKNYKPTYLDFASTTTTFLKIAEHKKLNHPEFAMKSIDSMIWEYTETFKHQTDSILGEDSKYVEFFMNIDDMVEKIRMREIK